MVYMRSLNRVQELLLMSRLEQSLKGTRDRLVVRVRRVDQVEEVGEGETCVHHCIEGTNMRLMIPPRNSQWRDRLFVAS